MSITISAIPPPPLDPRTEEFRNWLGQVHRSLTEANAIAWARVDKAGSSLSELATRRHDQLTELTDDDHSQYVHLTVARTISVTHTFSAKQLFGDEVEVDGALNHDGTTAGFFGTTPAPQQTVGAVTNNVTSGGVDGTIANYSDLAVYANDAATIRNNLYQLARSVAQLATAVRALGLGA